MRSSGIDPADIVTLDRVVCCYPDAVSLVSLSADRARTLYGLVLPMDSRLVRLAIWVNNLWFRLRRSPYRALSHSNQLVDSLVGERGLRVIGEGQTFFWRVVLYGRPGERSRGSGLPA